MLARDEYVYGHLITTDTKKRFLETHPKESFNGTDPSSCLVGRAMVLAGPGARKVMIPVSTKDNEPANCLAYIFHSYRPGHGPDFRSTTREMYDALEKELSLDGQQPQWYRAIQKIPPHIDWADVY
ncbi:hypothetical protein CYLTODRAFT_492149 [Cylindrobasidium torrendii FP15055 ss-10]|uniref:Uncharacterized protein n=1 Tax=Cylindrobasidium torrendii FP15055 ss-10 TaxID=1314674 RepID=A0A0D7B610_9AGAR|nr:hypothetical protein CYLTODRAFT_492149 [Cylindrobasidium torrendii FP15055 ss-10]